MLATLAGGLAGIPALVGFGSAAPGVTVLSNTIDLAGIGVLNYAFAAPRNGTIDALSASFIVTAGVAVAIGSVSVAATLYTAPAGSALYTATAATVTLTPAVTTVTIGEVLSGSVTGLSIPVTTGEQLMLVFSSVNSSPLSLATTLTGSASAGLSIV